MASEVASEGVSIFAALAMLVGLAGLSSCLWQSKKPIPVAATRCAVGLYLCVLGPWLLQPLDAYAFFTSILMFLGTVLIIAIFVLKEPGESTPLGPMGP